MSACLLKNQSIKEKVDSPPRISKKGSNFSIASKKSITEKRRSSVIIPIKRAPTPQPKISFMSILKKSVTNDIYVQMFKKGFDDRSDFVFF